MLRRVVVTLCCVSLLSACVSDDTLNTTIFAPTLLTTDPMTFLGTVRCGSELRKYVVRLFDVSTGTALDAGSGPPTDCTLPTTFGTPKITADHFYIAEIDGYDRDDIAPKDSTTTGSHEMVDPTGAPVAPRWTTTCGELVTASDDGSVPDAPANPLRFPTEPLDNIEVVFHGCLPLRTAEAPDAGTVDADDASPADGPADTTSDATDEPSPEDASASHP
jgi:hypothetical protein